MIWIEMWTGNGNRDFMNHEYDDFEGPKGFYCKTNCFLLCCWPEPSLLIYLWHIIKGVYGISYNPKPRLPVGTYTSVYCNTFLCLA
jgi:hypothetical protein